MESEEDFSLSPCLNISGGEKEEQKVLLKLLMLGYKYKINITISRKSSSSIRIQKYICWDMKTNLLSCLYCMYCIVLHCNVT